MRAGRLPENHPLEQLAREKLRAPSPNAAIEAEHEQPERPATVPVSPYVPPPSQPHRPPPKRRWG